MTTTVLVKARAHGAKVDVRAADGSVESAELAANQDREFHITEGGIITVQQGDAPAAEEEVEPALRTGLDPKSVPGRAENDKLVQPASAAVKTSI